MSEVLEILKPYRKVCILTVAMLVVLIVCAVFNSGQANRLRDVKAQTSQLQSNLKVLEQKAKEKNEATVLPSGLNINRFESDRELLSSFLKELLTFSSYDEYNANRMRLISEYGFNQSDELLRIFYQGVTEDEANIDRYLHVKNPDGNYELSFDAFTPYIIRIDDGEYTYLCDVTTKSQGRTYRFGVVCSVDDSDTISFAQAYALMPEE